MNDFLKRLEQMEFNKALEQKADLDLVHRIVDENKGEFETIKTCMEELNSKLFQIEAIYNGKDFITKLQDTFNTYKESSTLQSF